jgi:hypothetical protein
VASYTIYQAFEEAMAVASLWAGGKAISETPAFSGTPDFAVAKYLATGLQGDRCRVLSYLRDFFGFKKILSKWKRRGKNQKPNITLAIN